ncbi:hypothetical protein GCM10027435_01400 [Haloparvum alkalitolerans]|uniref:DUF7312 domain-containing protein n=1 Tax=Haloparvum TaxID=1820337 RepID=UPI00071E92B8|nr:hypothetical protein [Haloparvum sedimenti]
MSRSDDPVGDAADADAADDEGGDWRFSIDEVGPDGVVEETSPGDEPIEPESIVPEHAVFVALGVLLAVGVVVVGVL